MVNGGGANRGRNGIASVLQDCTILTPWSIMVNIFDVARHILNTLGEMSPAKLHALCYYAQGWHLAMHGVPLFREDFVKCETWYWKRGAVEESTLDDTGDGHGGEPPPDPNPRTG